MNSNRVPLDQLDAYYAEEGNFWTMQVRVRRDEAVQAVEDRLNDEHKKNVKDAKERARLEAEFKWKNAKYAVKRQMAVPVPPVPGEIGRGAGSGTRKTASGMLARPFAAGGMQVVPGMVLRRTSSRTQSQVSG